jgi:hypothetical protein
VLNEFTHEESQAGARVPCNAKVNITRRQTSAFLEFWLCHNQGATQANIRSRVCVGVQTVLLCANGSVS